MPVSFDFDSMRAGLDASLLRTEDVSLISHTHGRDRRGERKILRTELQAAIKHGVKEPANPGRDGSPRWRYEYNGVVYITDETSRHEVTSWRKDGKDTEPVAHAGVELAGKGSHAVLIVDSSGSMKKNDVPGYKSRADAVYQCLIRDFVTEQVSTGAGADVVVSLITMGDEANTVITTQPLDESLITELERIDIPALDKALEVMTADAPNRGSLLLLFFSDGAPSDQAHMQCEHGVPVFQVDRKAEPLMQHKSAASAWTCRSRVHDRVKTECLSRIRKIGDVFGKEKVVLRTLAFGPPNEDFKLLEEMAAALPRGAFQKLGLNADKLRTAFSSLSSSMTELRTEGGGRALTRRNKVVNTAQVINQTSQLVRGYDGWWIYAFNYLIGKFAYNAGPRKLLPARMIDSANGLAFVQEPFAEGAERFVYRCTEIEVPESVAEKWFWQGVDAGDKDIMMAYRRGIRLVAKEAKDEENLEQGRAWHETFARLQEDARIMAQAYSQMSIVKFGHKPEWHVSYLPTNLYQCSDETYVRTNQEAWVLVEPELEGKFTKWNNNAGGISVRGGVQTAPRGQQGLGVFGIIEEDEDEDEDGVIVIDDVPQAFSHFTYEYSRGKKLVCDLQGVWNADDGFVLTDPVVHYISSSGRRHHNGATDKGVEGVKRFFRTHKCGALCKRMGLQERSDEDLLIH